MCYHFEDHDTQDYIDDFVTRHSIKSYTHRGFRYYINGFTHAPCVALKQGGDELVELKWGLIPLWAKSKSEVEALKAQGKEARTAEELAKSNLNAKCETVTSLPSFRHCITKQKCLIIAHGIFEWRHLDAKNKIPYLIGVRDTADGCNFRPFTFGGIFDKWIDKDTGEVHETFSIITTPANSLMATIHNSKMRMPLIIPDETQKEWLNTTDPERIKQLMVPFPTERMLAHTISKHVSQTKLERNVPEVLQMEEYEELSMDEFL
jgi:putative SOS response-associated peptidase YedK